MSIELPDINWSDESIIEYAHQYLPHFPIVYVSLDTIDPNGPDTAEVKYSVVTRRFKYPRAGEF